MGDVHRYVESADWLVYSASEIAKAIGVLKPQAALYELRTRLKYGVKPDILDLVGLRGIGRIRGRMLHSHGYKTIADLYHTTLETIARVPTIGSSVAESIKKQLGAQVGSGAPELSDEEAIPDANGALQTMLDDFDEY
jgi:helicase